MPETYCNFQLTAIFSLSGPHRLETRDWSSDNGPLACGLRTAGLEAFNGRLVGDHTFWPTD